MLSVLSAFIAVLGYAIFLSYDPIDIGYCWVIYQVFCMYSKIKIIIALMVDYNTYTVAVKIIQPLRDSSTL